MINKPSGCHVFLATLLSVALCSPRVWAGGGTLPPAVQSLSTEDMQIYESTVAHCANSKKILSLWKGLNLQVATSSAKSVIDIGTFNPDSYFDFVENKGLSPEFSRILHSMGFYHALNTCYGNDDVAKQAYFAGLLLSDAAGKIGGIKLILVSLMSIRSLAALEKISPWTVSFFKAAGATAAIYYAYSLIHYEIQPRTAEEKQQIDAVQAQAVRDPLNYVNSAKAIINQRIEEIDQSLQHDDLSPERRQKLTAKLQKLQSSIKQIEELQKKV